MSNNGMNYPMYNTFRYPQIVQQQSLYGQHYPRRHSQPPIVQYTNHSMYPPIPPQPQYNNSYDHLIQSAAETLAAFTAPSEQSMFNRHQLITSQKNNRRSTINPTFNTKNAVRTYYCEICRIECGGHTSYQAHIQGSKHIKKAGNTQNQQKTTNVFRCDLCDITCTNADAHQAHLDGSKHQKTLKLHLKLGKTIPEPVHQPTISTHESQSLPINEIKQSSMKLLGVEYIETLYDNTNTIKSYHCKLCDCTFNDANAKDTHLKGKRHRISYKKKVDPNLKIDRQRTKSSSPKQHFNDLEENDHEREINMQNNQIEIDEDTRYLMTLHERIIPSQNLRDTIEQFVSTVEAVLKSCSEQLSSSLSTSTSADAIGTVINKSPLMGFSRIGSLVKNLLIKTDRVFHIVVMCAEWPTRNLFDKVFSILSETWKNQNNIQCEKDNEIIQVYTDTIEGKMCVSISFTSISIQSSDNQIVNQCLTKTNCLMGLDAMHSVRWFQKQVSIRQHAPALIRCLRYKANFSYHWQSLSSEAIEILIEHTLTKSISPIVAFRRVLESLAGGLILSNGPRLRISWQTVTNKDIFDNLTVQERNDITYEAQIGLRLLAFGQINSWFEQHNILTSTISFPKRSYSDDDNQNSVKRQCTESEDLK
ncbi:hypothetical protein I4U23_023971 [Adineta vaga]|nr:hypothetical protein I4U23_023971 [Adineta vaga]